MVYEYNNFYHHSNGKKPIDVDYSGLTKEFETNIKLLNLELVIGKGLQSTKRFLAKVTPKIGQEKYLWWLRDKK